MSRQYAVFDVFTERPLSGNQLAVIYDADGLADAEMQAIAAEFRLSETVFVVTPRNHLHSAGVRIFTPVRELPFAGHPTIGTAVALGLVKARTIDKPAELVLMLEEGVGPVRCGVSITSDRKGDAVFDVPRKPEAMAFESSGEAIAAALGLVPGEIGFENHVPSAWTAGVPYAFVPVRDLSVISKVRLNEGRWSAAFPEPASAAYVYCRETMSSASHFHARMFAPEIGIVEDPATGSAVAAFPGVILRFDQPTAGSHRYVVEQGYEMGRPSLIGLEMDVEGGVVVALRIAGSAVMVATGELLLDG